MKKQQLDIFTQRLGIKLDRKLKNSNEIDRKKPSKFINKLEIKPCGLGSRIRDMEADMVNIFDLHGGCERPNTIQQAHTLAL